MSSFLLNITMGGTCQGMEHAKYLGTYVLDDLHGLCKDAKSKRAIYIERNIEINQEFPSAHPEVKCKINRIYNSSFPGSVLYDLTSVPVSQLINSWSVSVRHMWELPVQAHRCLGYTAPLRGAVYQTYV